MGLRRRVELRTPVLVERLPYQHEFHAGNFADVMKRE